MRLGRISRRIGGICRGLSNIAGSGYACRMKSLPHVTPAAALARFGIAVGIGVVLLAALAGWSVHGTAILFTYAQDGLAWCF